MNEKACLNLKERIIHSPCYLLNGSYNTRCLVALTKFICLERQLIMAYYDMCQAGVEYGILQDSSSSKDEKKSAELRCLHHLEHSIVEYNNCYDTVLQIVYFVFEFVPDFQTQKDYKNFVKGCKWVSKSNGIEKIFNNTISLNPDNKVIESLFDKLKEFYITSGAPIRKIANAIKHHGGISTKNCQIPIPPGFTLTLTQGGNGSLEKIQNAIKENCVFSPKSILPETIDLENTIKVLESKTSDIHTFAMYLFHESGLYAATEKEISITKTFQPPFSIIKLNGREQTK